VASTPRRPSVLVLAIIAIALVASALAFAFLGPASRAGAVASVLTAVASLLAALSAIYLSREALARTDSQVAINRRALVLSRFPLLVPLHEPVHYPGGSGQLVAHPPAQDRYVLDPQSSSTFAFLTERDGTCYVPLENVGEGAALGLRGALWCSNGKHCAVRGSSVLGAKQKTTMVGRLESTNAPLPQAFADHLESLPSDSRVAFEHFWLSLEYRDVFQNPRESFAVFYPHGVGSWRLVGGQVADVGSGSDA
jgi:hypothetical protein